MTKTTKSRFDISVTQTDIDRAFQSNSAKCVVVQAIARTLPEAHRIEVDTQTVRFTIGDERYAYLTPYSVTGYVIGFDAGDKITPFTFRLYQDQRVPIRRRTRTPAGSHIATANDRVKRATRKVQTSQQKLTETLSQLDTKLTDPDLPPPSPDEIRKVRAEVTAAKAEEKLAKAANDSARAAYGNEPQSTSNGQRQQPRVFKTNRREYGHRALRINQPK